MSLLTDLRDHLQAQGFTTPVARGKMPDQPDECLALNTYGGSEGRLHDDSGRPVDERPRVQVVARAATQARAEAIALEAYRILQWRHLTVNGRTYPRARALQAPFYGGEDESGRVHIAWNLEVRANGPL